MRIDHVQLEALLAAVDGGTFEAAARALNITPSAVSQRIRSLEERLSQVVVQRTKPCRPTQAGEILLRLARQVSHLEAQALAELSAPEVEGSWTTLAIAVNADSLATWFQDVIADVATWDRVTLVARVEDQAHTASLLRSGAVLAAVTAESVPVQGCISRPLGTMRYHAVAAPTLVQRWARPDGSPDLSCMPFLQFNDKDEMQHDLLARMGVRTLPPMAVVPNSDDFYRAVLAGLAWGNIPDLQLGDDLHTGRLVPVTDELIDIPLFWQQWRISSASLEAMARSVTTAAARHLVFP